MVCHEGPWHVDIMRKRNIWIFLVVAVGGVFGCFYWVVFGPATRVDPPTPPLLQDATATGGWSSGGCPPTYEFEKTADESKSPEIVSRLKAQYPPGTPSKVLVDALLAQHFTVIARCSNDASIKRAIFRQTGGGFFGPYPAFANVAWKVDANDRIVWTKAAISYTGP
jgi:hypothetical protein